ncbi:ester cyclase [Dyadobacter crusticola]|uniref:ester cyclase n=1 Tax=Dyadobacter crusticola TaxID=292407 RepID=UPI00068AEC82|nr:ester cyclase [Dyadobacter crusticola]
MKNSEVLEIAENYMHVWSAGNDGLLEKFAAGDLHVEYTHFPKSLNGIEEYRRVLKQTYNSFPDIKILVKEIDLSDNKAIVKWTYVGTHLNDILFGVEPSGRSVKVDGVSILDINQGKVVREYGIVDNLSLLIQLGAVKI